MSHLMTFDIYATDINFLIKGHLHLPSFIGIVLSISVLSGISIIILLFLLFTINTYNDLQQIELNPKNISSLYGDGNYSVNLYTPYKNAVDNSNNTKYIDSDYLIYGFLILDSNNKILMIDEDNQYFKIEMYLLTNNINPKKIDFNYTNNCREVLTSVAYSSFDLSKIYSDQYFYILSNFSCLNWTQDFILYSSNNISADHIQIKLLPKNGPVNQTFYIYFFYLNLNFNSGGYFTSFQPIFYEYKIINEITYQLNDIYQIQFFYNRVFNFMKKLNLTTKWKDNERLSSSELSTTRKNNNEGPYLIIDISFSNIIISRDTCFSSILINLGLMGNLCFLCFFIGKVIFQYLKQDENTYYLMNETMFIVDPKEKDKIKLWESNFKKDNQNGDGIVILKHVYNQYNQMENVNPILNKRREGQENNFYGFNKNASKMHEIQEKTLKDEENLMNSRKKIIKIVKLLKNEENTLFYQLNRFNHTSFFELRQEDRFLNYKTFDDKVLTDETCKEFFYKDSDFVSFFKSINTVRFMLYKIIFKEYQFFIFNNLSRQSFMGNFLLGFEIDRFFSRFIEKDEYLKKVDKYRRALKKFRKNENFKKNDKNFLNLLNNYVQENLIKNMINHLKIYYKEMKALNIKLDIHGIKPVIKSNSKMVKTLRTVKSIKTNKTKENQ